MNPTAHARDGDHGWILGVDIGTMTTVGVLAAPDGRLLAVRFGGAFGVPTAVAIGTGGDVVAGRSADDAVRAGGRSVPGLKAAVGRTAMRAGPVRLPVVEALAAVLREVIAAARDQSGHPLAAIAVGCPASWDDRQRHALTRAAHLAGAPEARLVPEPVCVAEYLRASGTPLFAGQTLAVYDFGAAHADVSLVHRDDTFHVSARAVTAAGGGELDDVVQRLAEIRDRPGRSVTAEAARIAREQLSTQESVRVEVAGSAPGPVVARRDFEIAAGPTVRRSAEVTAGIIADLGDPGAFAGLFLTGGVSRTPLIRNMYRVFRRVPIVVDRPEFAVAAGAALHARPGTPPVVDRSDLPEEPAGPARTSPRAGVRPAAAGAETVEAVPRWHRRLTSSVAGLAVLAVLLTSGSAFLDRPRSVARAPEVVRAEPPAATPSPSPTAPPAPPTSRPVVGPPSRSPTRSAAPPATSRPAARSTRLPPLPVTFTLRSPSGLCATPDEPRDQDAIPIRLQTCTGDTAQRWRRSDVAAGRSVLRNIGTGKCLDLNTAPDAGDGLVQQWLCRDNDHQKWRISPASDGTVALTVKITGDCLSRAPGQDTVGGLVQKAGCASTSPEQRWRLVG